jgi:hypothetical protein
MKNFLQILFLSIGLVGCSSIDYAELTKISSVSPANFQIERILALNLSHSESLIEANKLMDSNLASTVVKELEARKLKADNADINAEKVTAYAEMVKVSDGGFSFLGSQISDTKKRNMIGKPENLNYYLLGLKDTNNVSIQHKLILSISYTSSEKRNYSSASYCDKWDGCNSENLMEITLISSIASGCSSYECDYTEKMELNLSDDLLRSNMKDGLSMSFNSKKANNKITLTPFYLKGYLSIAK